MREVKQFHRINEKIRFSPVMVVDEKGNNLGILSTDEARRRARLLELDLVEVAPNARPPVCRIMSYGKFKYEQSIKEKKQKAKSNLLKELRLSPRIADHDIQTKANLARRFLEGGYKVQFRLEYKRRENEHRDLGFSIMKKITGILEDIGSPEKSPNIQGNVLVCVFVPKGNQDESKRNRKPTEANS
jgi:translation initiation factor IF-3